MPSSNDIRATFLDFFARHGHQVVESSPLVPRNDPTLLFTNAGMVQFKNVFTGLEHRPYTRAATSQKCVRAGGKHNDLDNVGYTARHHTFFEMLGNFSFGDYFKETAIELAWTLVTKEWALPPERLMVTVHTSDEDAAGIWRKVAGLPDSRIVRIPTSDNFWAMGDTGPCGPCSEIFFDYGPTVAGGPPGSPDGDGDRWVEIWNLVFMQFEQVTKEQRIDLPRPSIDTGAGLERVSAVLQGRTDTYATDTMRALILASAEATSSDPDGPHRISHRVVADHLRSACFLIADGVLPSNEGRGYVLRRIMRRAMRHAHMIGARDPLMWRLVPALIRQMGAAYHELARAEPLIVETLRLEETRFKAMLERGLGLLVEETARLGDGAALPGEAAFKLYDTFGFPLDLTQDALREQGRGVDLAGFQTAMDAQRERARAAWKGSGEAATDAVWFELKDSVGATEFQGYTTEANEAVITAIVRDGQVVQEAHGGETVALLLNQTPFYAESGGQVGDMGVVTDANGLRIAITDTQKRLHALYVHIGRVEAGIVRVGGAVEARVDTARRARIRANHSATHLLHEALRRRLGLHVAQKGSLVTPDRLRFDISHNKPITAEDLAWVEAEVNARVRENASVSTRLMSPEEAVEKGAIALFGEKYGEEVRVVTMGRDAAMTAREGNYSVELCGGTHVRATGEIGLVKLVGEGAVAAGVRRVEALTGEGALSWVSGRAAAMEEAAAALKVRPEELAPRVAALVEERRNLAREVAELKKKLATGGGAAAAAPAGEEVGGVKFAGRVVEVPARDLKGLADELRRAQGGGVVALVSTEGGKASIVVSVSEDLVARLSAVELVKAAAGAVGGKGGGGRPDMAQAGGPDAANAEAALAAVRAALAA